MQSQEDRCPLNVRALLESTGTHFAVAGYGQRAVVFFQRDACDSVMHIEKGCVRLAVTAPSGREAIVGLLGTGAFLGEEALGGHAVRRQTATAMVSQEIIAEMVGTTRSRVNVFMGKFKKLGFIEEDGGVLQVRSSLLHVVHDGNRGVSNRTSPACLRR